MNTESNKLIAEFLHGKNAVHPNQYHENWNELMQVVEKIESLIFPNDEYYNFQILGGCCVYIISSHCNELVCSDNGKSKLECVYDACIEFVKWYNQNTQQNEK